MGGKDIAARALLGHGDVFASAFNALLFDGEEVMRPEDLKDAAARSGWSDGPRLRDQERDVAKWWCGCGVRLALLGVENQSAPDPDMALRVIGYDGASYRAQADLPASEPRRPVVTVVLYFGKQPWGGELSLLDRLEVPERLRGLVSDYRALVFDIPRLAQERRDALRDDLFAVADYLAQTADGGDYVPPEGLALRHPGDTMRMMRALTGDRAWEDAILPRDDEGEETTMTEILERYVNMGIEQGLEQGIEQGIEQGASMERDSLAALFFALSADGRTGDFAQALYDDSYRRSLCDEYGIEARETACRPDPTPSRDGR